jgi:hypothetical protein
MHEGLCLSYVSCTCILTQLPVRVLSESLTLLAIHTVPLFNRRTPQLKIGANMSVYGFDFGGNSIFV